jgi:hypothetical protein
VGPALVLSAVLAVVFGWAGLIKVFAPGRWRKDLQAYRLPRPLRAFGLLLVPWLELLVPAAVVGGQAGVGAGLAVVLLLIFSAAIVRARILVGSNQLACGCFGGHATRDYRLLLLRNALLMGPAAYVLASGISLRSARVLAPVVSQAAVVFGGLAVAAAAWVLLQVGLHLRQRHPRGSVGPG